MSYEYSHGHCDCCEAPRKMARPKPNHILHFLITMFTCGLWALVWAGSSVQFGGWRCDTCGAPM